MILVRSTEDEGVCYVETKNLDGETNLKNKRVPKDLLTTFENTQSAIRHFDGTLTVDGPNNFIYKFEGRLEMVKEGILINEPKSEVTIPLTNENVLLRGMSLRNVEETIGIVVYTGHETKI